jgi:hypothetical protein
MSSVATWTSGTFESCDSLRNTSNACRSQWDAKVDFSNKPKRVKASSPALIGVHAQERFVTKVVRCTKDSHLQLVSDASGRYIVKVAQEVVFESRVLAAAEIYYAEEVDKHRAFNRGVLARERAHFDVQALRDSELDTVATNLDRMHENSAFPTGQEPDINKNP